MNRLPGLLRRAIRAAFVLTLLTAGVGPAGAIPHGAAQGLETTAPTGRIVLAFTEASGLHVLGSALQPATHQAASAERALRAAAPGFSIGRRFSRTPAELRQERESALRQSGEDLPDLNRWAQLDPSRVLPRAELLRIVEALRAQPWIEAVFLEPVAVPAALGFDAFDRSGTDREIPTALDPGLPTPDFSGSQGYLDPAPTGVDAEGVWGTAGGRGQTVKVLDIEGAWLWTHEDLPSPFFTAGGEIADLGWRNHGTAVMGEIRGVVNGYGVTGIANEVQVGGVSIAQLSVADAINTAAANLAAGDIFLIELHAPGPNANGQGQFGYVCMEYWQDNFEAIRVASANGRICCEAAGNGQQNLDDPIYQGLFDRDVRDSGAILCGASNGADLNPAYFTNYGERVDLHGWGFNVVTTGYGDLQGGNETQWYTSGFSGTSSASPIVVGSVASLQGMCKAAFGMPLTPKLARDILVATGTAQQGLHHIGPRPNLTAARTRLMTGVGAVAGTVTDAVTGLPVEDVTIEVAENGAFARTSADGSYYLSFLSGTYTLSYSSFFHQTRNEVVTIQSGQVVDRDVALERRPLTVLSGTVIANDGSAAVAGMAVTPLGVPVDGTVTDESGHWSIPDVPSGVLYELRFDGVPGYGADYGRMLAWGAPGLNIQVPLARETFEGGPGGYSADPIWSWGTPGADGPEGGFSGTRCWGVGMNGWYGDNQRGNLTSPSYDFAGEDDLRLSFHYWCETEPGFDGANVQVWNSQAARWDTLTPLTGYNSISLGGIDYENGWSGNSGGWVGTVFDLRAYISNQVRFRIQFGSDGGVTGPGFWVDEVAFDTGNTLVSVEMGSAPATASLSVQPNPASSAPVGISVTLAVASPVTLTIHDLTGRAIAHLAGRVMPAGPHVLVWDGRDAAGEVAPGGVYFVRASGGVDLTRRFVLLR